MNSIELGFMSLLNRSLLFRCEMLTSGVKQLSPSRAEEAGDSLEGVARKSGKSRKVATIVGTK
jgi:hypothetical protein